MLHVVLQAVLVYLVCFLARLLQDSMFLQASPENDWLTIWHTISQHILHNLQGGCPEDTVDAATLASGYKWVPDSLRITEANEPLLSLTCHNAAYWDEHNAHALRQVSQLCTGLCATVQMRHTACGTASTAAVQVQLQ